MNLMSIYLLLGKTKNIRKIIRKMWILLNEIFKLLNKCLRHLL